MTALGVIRYRVKEKKILNKYRSIL